MDKNILDHEQNLYHYTSFESAIKILVSQTLLFSKIETLNDIHESAGPMILTSSSEGLEEIESILKHYLQISLTCDTDKRKGYAIPSMWGHYAQKGHGVCLVFDKERIMSEVKKYGLYARPVTYMDQQNPNDYLYDRKMHGSPENFISTAKDVLFFVKSRDWEYEQEFRVIRINEGLDSLPIKDTLKAIILYSRTKEDFMNSLEFKTFKKLVNSEIKILNYTTKFYNFQMSDTDENTSETMYYDLSFTSII